MISRDDALAYGLVGPDRARRRRRLRRAQGVSRTSATRRSSSTCRRSTDGDVYARYLVRVAEMRESVKICRQALERISPIGAYAVADPRITPPPKDRVLHGNGSADPALPRSTRRASRCRPARRTCRSKGRAASRVLLSCPTARIGRGASSRARRRCWPARRSRRMIVGGLIADVIAVIGSIDVVMGDVDR